MSGGGREGGVVGVAARRARAPRSRACRRDRPGVPPRRVRARSRRGCCARPRAPRWTARTSAPAGGAEADSDPSALGVGDRAAAMAVAPVACSLIMPIRSGPGAPGDARHEGATKRAPRLVGQGRPRAVQERLDRGTVSPGGARAPRSAPSSSRPTSALRCALGRRSTALSAPARLLALRYDLERRACPRQLGGAGPSASRRGSSRGSGCGRWRTATPRRRRGPCRPTMARGRARARPARRPRPAPTSAAARGRVADEARPAAATSSAKAARRRGRWRAGGHRRCVRASTMGRGERRRSCVRDRTMRTRRVAVRALPAAIGRAHVDAHRRPPAPARSERLIARAGRLGELQAQGRAAAARASRRGARAQDGAAPRAPAARDEHATARAHAAQLVAAHADGDEALAQRVLAGGGAQEVKAGARRSVRRGAPRHAGGQLADERRRPGARAAAREAIDRAPSEAA